VRGRAEEGVAAGAGKSQEGGGEHRVEEMRRRGVGKRLSLVAPGRREWEK